MSERKPAADRKTDIFKAMLALAYEVGPDQVTTGMIASRLDLTQPALYKHFPTKAGIWQAVGDHLSLKIVENINNSQVESEPTTRLNQLVSGHLQLIARYPALPEIMLMRNKQGPGAGFHTKIRASMSDFRLALTSCVTEAKQSGKFRADIDANDAATLVFGIIQSLVLRMILNRDPTRLSEDGARLLKLQLSGFIAVGENS